MMKRRLKTLLLAIGLCWGLLPGIASAGFEDGLAAYNKRDYTTAFREWQPIAIQGNAKAQTNLGYMYQSGLGVARDDKEAVKWYLLAAGQGDPDAQFNLGVIFDNGRGMAQDFKEAARWFSLAAEQGDAPAQYNLGFMYESGRGLVLDYKQAIRWYRLAAASGDPRAQYNLAGMYGDGHGVNSRVVAYALYTVSAATDPSVESRATSNRSRLAQTMKGYEIKAAQDLTRELKKPKNFLRALDQYTKDPIIK